MKRFAFAYLISCASPPTPDFCPDDPAKAEAGSCGCGVTDADANNNGVPDCLDAAIDLCPDDAAKTQAGVCGCGMTDADANNNGVPDCLDAGIDLCPGDAAKTQAGACGCGVADADANNNGVPDCVDFPRTCRDLKPQATVNGVYTLYLGGVQSKPWEAYCHGMNRVDPHEYLTVEQANNVSEISNGATVGRTSYRRYRFDPLRMEIDPLDDLFATSEDLETFTLMGERTHLPAGWAEFRPAVDGDGPPAHATLSLNGTAFAFDEVVLTSFFCVVVTGPASPGDSSGSEAMQASDLKSFSLTAINVNGDTITRHVGDCANLGGDALPPRAVWPLVYAE